MKTHTAHEVKAVIEAESSITLLHVLPEEHFDQQHLPGAVNACVYEMVFLSSVAERVPDKASPIIVYGAGESSLDSAVAAKKLETAGYSNIADFRGGLAEWLQQGFATEGTGLNNQPACADGTFLVELDTSVVRWTGWNLFNHHSGTVKLVGGQMEIQNGELQRASFSLDMNSIACEDLTDSAYNAMLIQHLRDDDFFAVDRFPTADFLCTSAVGIPAATPGSPSHTLHGALTLRGVTQPLSFPAVIAAADSDHLTGQAQFEIDRTQFGSLYGSGRFFAFLGKHVVNDHIQLHVKLHAQRS
jgi:polyisoprenoid-binding protein YceI/rhodanese-related sulfurtransferase